MPQGWFHFLKTLDFCHYSGEDRYREPQVLSFWPETSNLTRPKNSFVGATSSLASKVSSVVKS